MRNLLSIVLCLCCSYFAIGQQNNLNSRTEKHMEVRFIPRQGLSYRLAPDLPFQKAGVFNKNMKPYFKQYDEALRYHKKSNRNYLGALGGSIIYGVGMGNVLYGASYNDPSSVRVGGISAIIGTGLMVWSSHKSVVNRSKAIDAYNRNKNTGFLNMEYLEVMTYSIPQWKFRTSPSEDYQSTGIYGSKLATYFEENEDAFSAYKKYKTSHIVTSAGSLTMLVGGGIILTGVFTDNSNLSKNGLITSAGGAITVMVASRAMNKYLYQAIDIINYKDSPILNSSLIPSLQPSSYSAGLGLVWNIE